MVIDTQWVSIYNICRPDQATLEGSSCTILQFTVFSTPDDGCCDTRNMYSDFAVNKYLHTVASGWILLFVIIFSTPDEGCCYTRNMYSDFAVNKYLHTAAYGWIFTNIDSFTFPDRSVS